MSGSWVSDGWCRGIDDNLMVTGTWTCVSTALNSIQCARRTSQHSAHLRTFTAFSATGVASGRCLRGQKNKHLPAFVRCRYTVGGWPTAVGG